MIHLPGVFVVGKAIYGPVCVLWSFSLQVTENLAKIKISAKTARKLGTKLFHWHKTKNDQSLRCLCYQEG